MLARLFLLITFFGLAAPAWSQTGHPAKGSWSGELVSFSESEPERVRLLIEAWDGELSGTLNPGRRGIEMSSVELDAESWTLSISVQTPEGPLMMEGKLSNLGSWTNRKYIGSFTRGDDKGTFNITLN